MLHLLMNHNKWFHSLIQMKNINLKNSISLEFLKKDKNLLSCQLDNNILFKLYHLNNNSLILLLFKLFHLNKELIIMYSLNFKRRWMSLQVNKLKIKRTCKNNEWILFLLYLYITFKQNYSSLNFKNFPN